MASVACVYLYSLVESLFMLGQCMEYTSMVAATPETLFGLVVSGGHANGQLVMVPFGVFCSLGYQMGS